MARKYTKVEHLISIIEERTKAGETYREIGASLGLTREEVCGAMHRHHAKERKLVWRSTFYVTKGRIWERTG